MKIASRLTSAITAISLLSDCGFASDYSKTFPEEVRLPLPAKDEPYCVISVVFASKGANARTTYYLAAERISHLTNWTIVYADHYRFEYAKWSHMGSCHTSDPLLGRIKSDPVVRDNVTINGVTSAGTDPQIIFLSGHEDDESRFFLLSGHRATFACTQKLEYKGDLDEFVFESKIGRSSKGVEVVQLLSSVGASFAFPLFDIRHENSVVEVVYYGGCQDTQLLIDRMIHLARSMSPGGQVIDDFQADKRDSRRPQ